MKLRLNEHGVRENQDSFPVCLSAEYHHQVLFYKIWSIEKGMKENFIEMKM